MKNIIPIIIIIGAIIFFVTIVQPVYDKIAPLQGVISQYQSALAKADDLKKRTDDLTAQYNAVSAADLARLDKMIPVNPDNVHLITDINNVAAKYGGKVTNVKITSADNSLGEAQPVTSQTHVTQTISFTTSLSYPNFVQFMRDLEGSLRIMDVRSISFIEKDNDISDYQVTMAVYSAK